MDGRVGRRANVASGAADAGGRVDRVDLVAIVRRALTRASGMILSVYGRLAAVTAKIERATQQIAALIHDIGATLEALQGHPFTMVVTTGADGLPHTFELSPRWTTPTTSDGE